MEQLLDRISQEGLLVVCIILAVVALLLAILITYEICVARKRHKVVNEAEDDSNKEEHVNELNIKYDENITYEESNSDEDRIKAKEELQKIKNKLIDEDNKKKLEEEKKNEVAKKIETEPLVLEKLEDDDSLEGTKEYKVFTDINENKKENNEVKIEIDKDFVSSLNDSINKEVKVDTIIEENKTDDDSYTAKRNEEEVVPVVEEVNNIEPTLEVKENVEKYTAKKEDNLAKTIEIDPSTLNNIEIKKEEVVEPIVNENKEEQVEKAEVKENIKLDNATKEYLIDEYLKQAILTRINEEKEKQLQLKEKIERERRVLLADDPVVIPDTNSTNNLEEQSKEVDTNVDNLEKLEDVILEKDNIANEIKDKDIKSSVYEELEEENAIISYDELLKANKFGYTDEEMDNYVDEKDAIISMDELQKLFKEVNEVSKDVPSMDFSNIEFKKVEDLPKISDEKKFKKSDVISPVFGQVIDDKELELEKTQNLNKLSEEIKKTNEFLKTLKELQKNLE
jgi:hypothetical protein